MGDGFAWTIPLIHAGFGILFLVARRAGAATEAALWGRGFGINALAFALTLLAALIDGPALPAVADLGFAYAFYCFGGALVTRFGATDTIVVRRALLAAAMLLPLTGLLVLGSVQAELVGSDLGCAVQLLYPLVALVRWPRWWVDRALILLSWIVLCANFGRTLVAPLPSGLLVSAFPETIYSYLMYADAMVTGCAFSILALVAVTTELVARLRREAGADPLTGLLNRRGFDRAVAGLATGGVVACDLDHFKRVNDLHGHDVGDRVLVAFSEIIDATIRREGLSARLGGEEFVVYLPGASLASAQAAAMRLRARIADHDWRSLGIDWALSASFGVAAHGDGVSLAEALREADAHLYDAKRAGRDRVLSRLAA